MLLSSPGFTTATLCSFLSQKHLSCLLMIQNSASEQLILASSSANLIHFNSSFLAMLVVCLKAHNVSQSVSALVLFLFGCFSFLYC